MIDVKNLTIDEKLKLLTGKDNWQTNDLDGKIPSIFMADGPHGLRKKELEKTDDNVFTTWDNEFSYTRYATAMPNLSVLANSWNTELSYLEGATIADDCIDAGVDVLLAPGVNMKRNVLCGRNFEYFSEDPFVAGKMARAYIKGVQDKGVGTSLKHYICNNSEHDRRSTSSEIDERTMREIYLPAFEECLKENPWTVMCSYNPVNGVYASQHKKLLKTLLRDELGFNGTIVSDWGAVHDHPKAVKATLDVRMPYSEKAYDQLKTAFDNNEITEEEIDFCVSNLLKLVDKKVNADKIKKATTTKEERHKNAVEIAKESIVLLKNEDSLLPISKVNKISVIGKFDTVPPVGAGGSSNVVSSYQQTPLSTLLKEKTGAEIYASSLASRNPSADVMMRVDYLKRHLENAYTSDVVFLCLGENDPIVSEGYDREKMKLTTMQENFILNTCKYNINVVVLLYASSAIDMSAWIDKVKAVVFVGFAGEGVNEALCSILTGKTVPSGKLTETFPLCIEDTVTKGLLDDGQSDWYKEGLFIGYRHYDKNELNVLYPFGYGLSYASFEYSDLSVTKNGDYDYLVTYKIKNTSKIDAKEISQVYVKDVFSSVVRPIRELKGFSKDFIKAGEEKTVTINLDKRAFAYYSVAYDEWIVEKGSFVIEVGSSSRDIKLSVEINI